MGNTKHTAKVNKQCRAWFAIHKLLRAEVEEHLANPVS
jgi:hypothetical protein